MSADPAPARLYRRPVPPFWWLHRRYYRGLKVSSIPPPSGILPGITFIVLGIALQVALANWFGP